MGPVREQVPVLAKADSMTTDELREFRGHVRSQLEHVRAYTLTRLCVALLRRNGDLHQGALTVA